VIRVAIVLAVGALTAAGTGTAAAPPSAADLESQIVCPVCETTLDQSTAPIALRMKAFIRTRIAAGQSEQQIKNALVDEFGPEVLAEPPGGGFGLLAWLLPLGALAAGALAVGLLVLTWSRRRDVAPAGADELDPELERLVDEELARFDA
jgi:cytochrome c-type biogenesis protein CcmH